MHITAMCPGCGTQYQVSPTMRDQTMRCPIPTCRTVFTVKPEAPPPPPPEPTKLDVPPSQPSNGPKTQRSGSVGDMVPILSAEVAVPKKSVPEKPVPDKPMPARSQTFHVSDMVQLIQAEAVEPPPQARPPKPADAPSWREAPPPPRPKKSLSTPERTAPVKLEEELDALPVIDDLPEIVVAEVVDDDDPAQPVELPPGQWEPPPVRRGAGAAVAEPEVFDPAIHSPDAAPDDYHVVSSKARKTRWLMAAIIFVMVVLLGGGGGFVFVLRDTEEKLAKQAKDDFDSGRFTNASSRFQDLAERFPSSERHDEYAFLKQLSDLRNQLTTSATPGESIDAVQRFVEGHKEQPAFKQFGGDIATVTTRVLAEFTEHPAIDETTPDAVKNAEELLATIREALGGDKAIKDEDVTKLTVAFAALREQHATWVHRAEVIRLVEVYAKKPSADTIREAKRLVKAEETRLPGISQAPEVTRLIDQMVDGQLASVIYVPVEQPPNLEPSEDFQRHIYVAPKVQGSETRAGGIRDGQVVLALARGMLYALNRSDGRAIWAIRVGIDTTIPPVRVSPAAGRSERILVLSADTESLISLRPENGSEEWRFRLSNRCVGRPIIVDQRAFLPTEDGQVYEIQLLDGRLLGRYQLGQRLTCGGVRQANSPRLYFPGYHSCVYVLNVAERKCEAILYSDHLEDALRSEPMIVGDRNGATDGWLVLNQQQPRDEVQLRVFELPVKPHQTGELTNLKPMPRLQGWTWFSPQYDGEKLALVSDAGVLGVFGVHQERTRDAALFPWLPGRGTVNLGRFYPGHSQVRGRAEVVEMQGNDWWVLAHGGLQRLQLVLDGEKGPRLVSVWDKPIPLGEPLHASEVEIDRLNGHGTLFIVTQDLTYQRCAATALDDETGEIYWQRQLGLVSQGDPLLLKAADDEGPPLVLTLDHGGGLFQFDPNDFKPGDPLWKLGGVHVPRADPLEHNPRVAPLLLPGPDGESALEIACPGDGRELVIRELRLDGRKITCRERRVTLPVPLEGTPAVFGSTLILPLADGSLYSLLWKLVDKKAETGEDWRTGRASANSLGHVIPLGNDLYLTTDGSRGLKVYQVKENKWTLLPKGVDGSTLEMNDRIVTPPVVVAPAPPLALAGALGVQILPSLPRGPIEVCVADSAGRVSLLALGGDGSLKVTRQWMMKGQIKSGPFVRRQGAEVRLGCIIEERKGEQHLVWIDPGENAICWDYRSGGGALVGQPNLVEGFLVIGEEGGRYKALDPTTGQLAGPGYLIKGSIAPAAAPVAFGPNRLFAPLSDGTVLMLSMDQLRHR